MGKYNKSPALTVSFCPDSSSIVKVPSTIKNLYNQIKRNIYHSKKLKNIKKQFFNDGINIEYIEIRNKYDLSKKFNRKNFKIFVAFYIKNIRLIDNF